VFRVLGCKNISVGKRLTATVHPSDSVIAYDMAMTSGSSGAPLFRFDAPANTFFGIHLGGECYQDEQWPVGWNHGYTVANPHFALMYLRYVLPAWEQAPNGVPEAVRQYVQANHDIINAHQPWLTNERADVLLSL